MKPDPALSDSSRNGVALTSKPSSWTRIASSGFPWLLFVVACIFSLNANAQDFSQPPATKLYQVQSIVSPGPIVESGNHACGIIAETLNGPAYVPPGTTQWREYTNPKYGNDPNLGEGCAYDVIHHGGIGGYPDGYVWAGWFAQNWVMARPACPAGYTDSIQYHPDSSYSWLCAKSALVASRPCLVCEQDKLFGNPISAGSGRKIEYAQDAAFGDGVLNRTFRSGSRWATFPSSDIWGAGWYGLMTARISYVPAGTYTTAALYALRPDGTVMPFLPQGGTLWEAESDLAGNSVQELLDGSNNRIGWKLAASNGVDEIYDADGLLISVERSGITQVELDRDAAGRLLALVDRQGRTATISYDTLERIDEIALPDGNTLTYTYDSQSRLASVTAAGSTKEYEYVDIAGVEGAHLSKVIDEDNSTFAEFGYDAAGMATSTQHAGGVDAFGLTYSNGGDDVDVVFPSGRTETYHFDVQLGSHKLQSAIQTCPGCNATPETRSYDVNGYPDQTTDRLGTVVDQNFNARGLVAQRIEAANQPLMKRTIQTDWHANFRVPTERRTYDAANTLVAKSTWTYNARGQALTATQTDPVTAAVRTSATTYCESADITNGTCPLLGLVTAVNGPRTDVTDTATYTYYASDDASCASAPTTCPHRKGDLWKITDALGRITETLAYDGAGRVLSVKDANNVVTDLTYHPRGWLTARKVRGTNNAVETDDQITQIEYWPTGLVKKVTQPDGAFTSYTYDAAHRLTDIADNAGNTIHYTLDNAGNRTAEDTKDSGSNLKRTLSRIYNQLGQLQTAKDAYNHATGFTYDANGNNELVTDALSRVTDNDYDPLNRLARTLQDVGGIEAETKFEYDARDNLTKVTDPKGLDTTYQYNGLGDLTQLASPDTGTTTYTYDSAGNRKTQTDARGIVSTYSYDALNRLTGIAYPTSSLNVGYVYDTANPICIAGETFAIGRLTQMTDSSGHTQYCYDRFGNLTRKVQTTNAMVFTLRYAYTLAGQLQAITYPDGAIVDYVRDGQGRITEVGATPAGGTRQILLNQATYHPFGPVAGWVYGNGRTMSRPLNQNYQPVAVSDNASGGLSLGYEFDAVGNLSKLYNADQSITKAQYGYDALNRLADVKDGPTGTVIEHYGYDATGNRTSFTNAGGTTSYTYPGTNHRLAQVGVTARTYDNVGNTTQIGGTTKEFVYNDAGRMSQVKASGATTMNYQLNGKGEQVRKYLNTNNTYTLYDEAGRWIGDYDSSGSALQQAIWLNDLPVGLLANNQLKYLQPDHLGTPRIVVDPVTNVVVWMWGLTGEAFGNTAPNQDPDGDGTALIFNMRFPGQRYDVASGLNYNYLRDYDVVSGRYVQGDPISLAADISLYRYVESNPLLYFDRTGLWGSIGDDLFPMPWDPMRCAEILQQIKTKRREIEKRFNALDRNSNSLPNTAPGPLKADRMGHTTIINILDSQARTLEDDYDKHCRGPNQECPVPSAAPVEAGEFNETPQTAPAAAIGTTLLLLIIAYFAFST